MFGQPSVCNWARPARSQFEQVPMDNPLSDDACPNIYRLQMIGQPLVCTWARPARSHIEQVPMDSPPPDDACPEIYRLHMFGQPLVCTWARPARSHFESSHVPSSVPLSRVRALLLPFGKPRAPVVVQPIGQNVMPCGNRSRCLGGTLWSELIPRC